jgi:hypothetical protein
MSAIRREMDHVVVLNERQLRRLLKKYLAHYHGSGALVCKRTQGVCGPGYGRWHAAPHKLLVIPSVQPDRRGGAGTHAAPKTDAVHRHAVPRNVAVQSL